MIRKDDRLEERDENVPGYRSDNEVDKKIVRTMVLLGGIVFLLILGTIALYFYLIA